MRVFKEQVFHLLLLKVGHHLKVEADFQIKILQKENVKLAKLRAPKTQTLSAKHIMTIMKK